MTKIIYIIIFTLTSFICFSQRGYKKIYKHGEFQENWSLVKSITGNYGFIDKDGKEIVPTIYAKIEKFGEYGKDIALVKSITGNYGFINKDGKVIVPTIYAKIEKFGVYGNDIALVKSIIGTYSLINMEGKEIIKPTKSLKEIKSKLPIIY